MRPQYESAKDRKLEKFFCFVMKQTQGLEYKKVPKSYHFDFVEEDLCEIAELKVRGYSFEEMHPPALMLSANKYVEMSLFPANSRVLYLWNRDGIYRANISDIDHNTENMPKYVFMGRKDRGDWQDMEPCVLYFEDVFRLVVDNSTLKMLRNKYNAEIDTHGDSQN